jgi:DNA-binding SARP family transcriptional activator/streptogramin lyase
VTIGAAKQRALLAYLLLHRGQVVPVGRLADALWEDAPPATATKTIQVYVAQLRKTLGSDLLVTEPGGYVAALNGHDLDERFQRELDEGARAFDAGRHAAAARALDDALGLWRGSALADLPQTHAIRDHAARLDEDRLWALEHRIDADIALGRHERLVAELRELVNRHPLREHLRAQLMTALYRCGRQAEALEVYREGRALLVEQLGLEPGAELRRLEHAILTHDPALAGPRDLRSSVRRRRTLATLAGAAVVVAAVLALVLAGDEEEAVAPPVRGDSLVAVDVVAGRIADEIRVGRSPAAVTADEGGVWVLNADDRTVSQFDPRARTVHTFGIGASPTDVAVGLGSLWIGNGGTVGGAQFAGETAIALTQLDPATGVERSTTRLPRSGDVVSNRAAQHIAFAAGSVWAINPDFSVSRIDPSSGRVVAVVRGLLALGLAGAGDELWAVTDDRTVTRIDTRRNRIARRIRVRAVALDAIALGAGSVWATDPSAGVLWRIEPSDDIVQRTIDVGAGADGLAYGAARCGCPTACSGR